MKVKQNFRIKYATIYYHRVRLLLARRTKKKLSRNIRKSKRNTTFMNLQNKLLK